MDDDIAPFAEMLVNMVERLIRLEQAVAVLLEERERRMPGRRFDHLLTDEQRLQIATVQQRLKERRASE